MERDLDKKLYNDYLNGEKQAFEYLYNKYKSKIEYFIYNIVKDYQKAEDLTQETFIYVMQNKMKENSSFKYYIYLVAKSKAFNYINKEKRRKEIDEQYVINENEYVDKDVLDIITRQETKKVLLDSINELEDKYKNAIYLVSIEGLSYGETANILGQTLQNTKSLIHRGKKQLRKILLKKGFDEMNKALKIVIIIALTTIMLTGITYASSILIDNIKNMLKSYEVEEKVVNEPVSKSDAPVGEIVFKPFIIMNSEKNIQLDNWQENGLDENKLYYKKINNYLEYKELMHDYSNLRTLNESDFENYFAMVVISKNINKSLKYKYITYSEDGEDKTMNILIDYVDMNREDIQYSGLVVIMTNKHIDYIITPKIDN